MSIKPIELQLSTLNTVHEAKQQQDHQNKGQLVNQSMQENLKSEVERNQSKVITADSAQGSLVDPDQEKEKEPFNKKNNQQNKKNQPKEEPVKEANKGIRLDVRI